MNDCDMPDDFTSDDFTVQDHDDSTWDHQQQQEAQQREEFPFVSMGWCSEHGHWKETNAPDESCPVCRHEIQEHAQQQDELEVAKIRAEKVIRREMENIEQEITHPGLGIFSDPEWQMAYTKALGRANGGLTEIFMAGVRVGLEMWQKHEP